MEYVSERDRWIATEQIRLAELCAAIPLPPPASPELIAALIKAETLRSRWRYVRPESFGRDQQRKTLTLTVKIVCCQSRQFVGCRKEVAMTEGTYQARHGDVMIVPAEIAELPADAKQRMNGVLAYGEVTGHMHRIADPASAQLFDALDGTLYMRVIEPTRIVHEEHQPITVPAGLYKVYQQREYQPGALPRRVTD